MIIIGEAGLKRDHDVPNFLAKEGKCHTICVCRDGIDAFERAYPFLVGQSLNAHRGLVYPSPVAPGVFLGNWANAEDSEKLKHLGIGRVLTIHNEPNKIKLPGVTLGCFCVWSHILSPQPLSLLCRLQRTGTVAQDSQPCSSRGCNSTI